MVEIEFSPDNTAPVVERMAMLSAAQDGWINLVPGVPDDDDTQDLARPSPFGALLGSAQSPLTMGTWMPARHGRRSREVTLGIMHPRGRRAVQQLAGMGIPLPEGWRVRQDHNRRGLILFPPETAPHADVLSWALRAGEALATTELTGSWQARVYEPLSDPG
jgi:hypothetical protein